MLASALEQKLLPELDRSKNLRLGPPIARPGAVYCIGMNYAAHAAESGSEPPQNLVVFMKAPNTVAGPNDTVSIPRNSSKTDWEVELAVVIGKRASYISSPEKALKSLPDSLLQMIYQKEIFRSPFRGVSGARVNLRLVFAHSVLG